MGVHPLTLLTLSYVGSELEGYDSETLSRVKRELMELDGSA